MSKPSLIITILGAGKVAGHLGRKLKKEGFGFNKIWSRTPSSATALARELDAVAVEDISELDNNQHLILFCIPDDAIEPVLSKVRHLDALFVHCSGATSLEVFKNAGVRGGVLYPLQSFSPGREINWEEVPVLIESNRVEDLIVLESLAKALSPRFSKCSSESRKKIHLAAVFLNNYVNYLLFISEKLIKKEGFSLELFRPLLAETFEKAIHGGAEHSQTGPAARGDLKTINKHLSVIHDPQVEEIYKFFSEKILEHFVSTKKT